MTNRRILRSALATILDQPASRVFEAARHIAPLCPADRRTAHGAKVPSPMTVALHLLATIAALPLAGARRQWTPAGRAAGLLALTARWAALQPVRSLTTFSGTVPPTAVGIGDGGLSGTLAGTLELLFDYLLDPGFLIHFGRDMPDGHIAFGDAGVQLALHGGHEHSFATLRFRFRDLSTYSVTFRHPNDDGQPEPHLTIRFGLGMRALVALAGVCRGVVNVEEIARGSARPIMPQDDPDPVQLPANLAPRQQRLVQPAAPLQYRRARFQETPEQEAARVAHNARVTASRPPAPPPQYRTPSAETAAAMPNRRRHYGETDQQFEYRLRTGRRAT